MLSEILKNTEPCICKTWGFCPRHKLDKSKDQWIKCVKNKTHRFELDRKNLYGYIESNILISNEQLITNTINIMPKIIDPKFIVGIPRSGMIPASIISTNLHSPLISLDQHNYNLYNIGNGGRFMESSPKAGNVIYLVDDSANTGNTLQITKKILSDKFPNNVIKTVAIFVTPHAQTIIDIYSVCMEWHFFEWNIHNTFVKTAYDFDGVLCRDFTEEEDDDGELYLGTMRNMELTKIQPRRNPLTIITGRLEKYREETEKWLKNHKYTINKLYMMNIPKEERTLEKVIKHKSDTYLNLSEIPIFFESCPIQSAEIFNLTKKTVICTSTNKVFTTAQ